MTTNISLADIGSVAVGASAVKNTGRLNVFRGAAQAAVVGCLNYGRDWRLAGYPVAVGIASSGWSDLIRFKVKQGVTKIMLASVIANGTKTAVEGQDLGAVTLKDIGVVSAAVAGAGLVHAVGSKIFSLLYPCGKWLVQKCVKEAVEDCTRPKPNVHVSSSPCTYT